MSGIVSMAPLIVLFVIFYFLLIRPQQKKAKEHKAMLSALQKGDNIVSTGGIFGRITSVNEDSITVEIAENVRVKMAKEAVTGRRA
ncbi:MAG: preprotein translocase subunit YajC [Deltaproteobacteria bacterium]